MSKKTIHVEEEVHEKAKILSAKTKLSIGEIIQLLIDGTSEKEILKLHEKKK
ncbi:MAG: hypothetical protein KDK36_18880 [Leptospiraceae bacterium]|nr:hypothetical protein [Leptospiraceae bacterium]